MRRYPFYKSILIIGFLVFIVDNCNVAQANSFPVPSNTPPGVTSSNVVLGNIVDTSKLSHVLDEDDPSDPIPYIFVDYNIDLSSAQATDSNGNPGEKYMVYVPPNYDGTVPYGLVIYGDSHLPGGFDLPTTCAAKNLIWICPYNIGNGTSNGSDYVLGAPLLAAYRAMELYNIDPRRVYASGLSGAARNIGGELGFLFPDLFHGCADSSGLMIPRLNDNDTAYLPHTFGNQPETFLQYSTAGFDDQFFTSSFLNNVLTTDGNLRQRYYFMTGSQDYREPYLVEAYHCAYQPSGLTSSFISDIIGRGHVAPSDNEMEAAIDYLDRDDVQAINAVAASSFRSVQDISQTGASAAISSDKTTVQLTPTLTAQAALRGTTNFYWCNKSGSTLRWMTEIKPYPATNQTTNVGVWLDNENWNGGVPSTLAGAAGSGILVTVNQTASGNELILSARNALTGTTKVFYDGTFVFDGDSGSQVAVPPGTYKTDLVTAGANAAGYLPGHPVEFRLDLNQSGFQLTLNGINIATTISSSNSSVEITNGSSPQGTGHIIYGTWGSGFWNQNTTNLADATANSWPSSIPAILTIATGANSGTGVAPSPLSLSYIVGTDPYIGTDPNINTNPSLTTLTSLHERPVYSYPNRPPAQIVNVVSRKTHGSAGTFDIDLPQGGTDLGIECRQGSVAGSHLLVVTLDHPVTNPVATVTSGTGTVASATVSGNQVLINLTGVANKQKLGLSLQYNYSYVYTDIETHTSTASGTATFPLAVGFYQNDFTGDMIVDSTDVQEVTHLVGQTATALNFRADTLTAGTITANDVPTLPSAPTGLTVSEVNANQATLTWTATPGATSYSVGWSTSINGQYTWVTGITSLNYTVNGVNAGTGYFEVEATNNIGTGPASPPVNAQTLYWDTVAGTSGLVNGSGNWDVNTTALWANSSSGSNPLLVFPNDDNAYFQTAGALTATIASGTTIKVSSINQLVNGTAATITGGTLQIDTSSGITNGVGSGNQALTINSAIVLNSSNVTINNATTAGSIILGGAISGVGDGITKTGVGTLVLSGANTYTGNTAVNAGILSVTGGSIGSTGILTIGTTSGVGAAMYQSAGTVTNTNTGGGGFQIGSTGGGWGYYNLSGGTINVGGEIDPGGSGGGSGTFGEFDMSGGTVNLPNMTGSYFLPDRGAAGEVCVVNISGGTVQIVGGGTPSNNTFNGLAVGLNNVGNLVSTITISGSAQFLTPSLTVKLNDTNFGASSNSTNTSVLNLNGGTLQTLGFGTAVNSGGGNGSAVINLNGGTIKAGNAGNTSFLSGLGAVYVYSGGGTINNNGQAITIAQPFLPPTGSGVTAVAVSSGGSGYLVPPKIAFSGGSGTGATAYATISPTTGAVTGIVITNPGTGYTSAPTVTLTGIGGSGATLGTVSIATNVTTGTLTFSGSGTTTLTGASTYSGGATLSAGTLTISGSGALGAASSPLVVNNANTGVGTTVTLNLNAAAATTVGSLSGAIAAPSSGVNTDTINNGGQLLTVNQTSAGTYAGVITGAGGFTLGSSSTNTLTLSGANTYTGATTINAGTLNLNGSTAAASTFALNSGATLSGTGTVGGLATIASGGILKTGNNGAGTLTFAGGLTLNSGAVLNLGLGSSSGKIALSGGTYTGPSSGTVTINLSSLAGFGAGTYNLITGAAGISAGSFTLGTKPSGYSYSLTAVSGTLSLVVTPPPAAPGALAAVIGDSQVALSWNASTYATAYQVQRATTSGGPYSTLVSQAGTSYTDTGLTNGTTYYYVVSASNAAGTSGNSTQIAATPLTPFQQWLATNGLPVSTSNSSTPDGDGIPLLLKYATGMTVGTPSAAGPAIVSTPASHLVLQFNRLGNPATVNYLVEASSDLANWTAIASLASGSGSWTGTASVAESGTNPIAVTVTDSTVIGVGAPRFLRLRVTTATDTTVPGTIPSGYTPLTIAASATTALSMTLDRTPVALDTVQAVTSGTITVVSAGAWANAGSPYALRLLSGNASGATFPITGVNGNVLTLTTQGVDLTQLVAVGDTYEILPENTFASLFGATGGSFLTGSSASVADNLQIWSSGVLLTYYNNGTAWKQSGSLISQNNTLLPPGSGWLVVRRGTTPLTFYAKGRVPEVSLRQYTAPGSSTFLASPYPVNMTLASTGFSAAYGWKSGSTSATADTLLVYSGNAWLTFYYNGTNWKQSGSLVNQNSYTLPANKPVFINRQSAPPATKAFVTQPLPYTP